MLTKQGVALTFYAFYVASKVGKTGLTVTLDIYETTSGSPIVSAASATELGGGLYYYTLASGSVDASGAYVAVFKTADSSVDQQHIPALWVTDTELKNLDAAVSTRLAAAGYTAPLDASGTQTAAEAALTAYDAATGADVAAISVPSAATVADAVASVDPSTYALGTAGYAWAAAGSAADPLLNSVPGTYPSGTAGHALGRIASGVLTVVQPVLNDGFVRIVGGSTYAAAIGTAIDLSSDGGWPSLPADVTIEWWFGDMQLAGSRVDAETVRLELTTVQSAALAAAYPGRRTYDILAQWPAPGGEAFYLANEAPCLVEA